MAQQSSHKGSNDAVTKEDKMIRDTQRGVEFDSGGDMPPGIIQDTRHSDPIQCVLDAAVRILEGDRSYTAAMFRQEIIDQMPLDLTEAEKYTEALKKMRTVGELIAQVAGEEFLVRKANA